MTDAKRISHTQTWRFFALHVHLVFISKYRPDVRSERAINDLRHSFTNVCEPFAAQRIECDGDGEDDHVDLLVNYPPKSPLQAGQQLERCMQQALAEYSARRGRPLP